MPGTGMGRRGRADGPIGSERFGVPTRLVRARRLVLSCSVLVAMLAIASAPARADVVIEIPSSPRPTPSHPSGTPSPRPSPSLSPGTIGGTDDPRVRAAEADLRGLMASVRIVSKDVRALRAEVARVASRLTATADASADAAA